MDFAPRLLPPVPAPETEPLMAVSRLENLRHSRKLQFKDPKATATEVAEHTRLLSEFDVPEGVVTPVARTKQYAHGAVDTFVTSYRYRVHYAGATQWFSSLGPLKEWLEANRHKWDAPSPGGTAPRWWLHVYPVCATLSLSACMNSCCVVCQRLQAQSLAWCVALVFGSRCT